MAKNYLDGVGTVSTHTRVIRIIEVYYDPPYEADGEDANAEYVIRVNGRDVRRIGSHVAQRYGLIRQS